MIVHDPISAFFFFLIGTAVGSFVNVLIWRLPREESIISPASHCPVCNAKIKIYYNIPILSYLILCGRCKNCKTKISIRYPMVEALMGLAYLAVYLFYNPVHYIQIIGMILMVPLFFAISWIDIEHWIIPDELTISVGVVGIILTLATGAAGATSVGFAGVAIASLKELLNGLIGAALGAFIFWIISIFGKKAFHKDAMGGGDIFLIGAIGFLVGWQGILMVIFIASLLGAIGGAITVLARKAMKKHDKENISTIPFGPFIVVATLIVMIAGDRILDLYLGSFM